MASGNALVISRIVLSQPLFGLTAVECIVQPSASYGTPGDIITPAQVGLTNFVAALFYPTLQGGDQTRLHPVARLTPGFSVTLEGTVTAPILRYWETATVEVADLQNKSAIRLPVIFLGS